MARHGHWPVHCCHALVCSPPPPPHGAMANLLGLRALTGSHIYFAPGDLEEVRYGTLSAPRLIYQSTAPPWSRDSLRDGS